MAGNENEIHKLEHDDTYHVKKTSSYGNRGDGTLARQPLLGYPYLQKIDEADATTTYIGLALPGTATSAASWQIKKIGVSSTVTTISWADGNEDFDNIFDNRASLSYS
jgi:hypothetical protein